MEANALMALAASKKCSRLLTDLSVQDPDPSQPLISHPLGWLSVASSAVISSTRSLAFAVTAAQGQGSNSISLFNNVSKSIRANAAAMATNLESISLALARELISHGQIASAVRALQRALVYGNPRSMLVLDAYGRAIQAYSLGTGSASSSRSDTPILKKIPAQGHNWTILSPKPGLTLPVDGHFRVAVDTSMLDPTTANLNNIDREGKTLT